MRTPKGAVKVSEKGMTKSLCRMSPKERANGYPAPCSWYHGFGGACHGKPLAPRLIPQHVVVCPQGTRPQSTSPKYALFSIMALWLISRSLIDRIGGSSGRGVGRPSGHGVRGQWPEDERGLSPSQNFSLGNFDAPGGKYTFVVVALIIPGSRCRRRRRT